MSQGADLAAPEIAPAQVELNRSALAFGRLAIACFDGTGDLDEMLAAARKLSEAAMAYAKETND